MSSAPLSISNRRQLLQQKRERVLERLVVLDSLERDRAVPDGHASDRHRPARVRERDPLVEFGEGPLQLWRDFQEVLLLGADLAEADVAQLLHQRRSRPGEVRRLVDKDGVPRDVVDHFRRGEQPSVALLAEDDGYTTELDRFVERAPRGRIAGRHQTEHRPLHVGMDWREVLRSLDRVRNVVPFDFWRRAVVCVRLLVRPELGGERSAQRETVERIARRLRPWVRLRGTVMDPARGFVSRRFDTES